MNSRVALWHPSIYAGVVNPAFCASEQQISVVANLLCRKRGCELLARFLKQMSCVHTV